MGKLFWKFFFGFWMCLLFAALVTGGVFYVLRDVSHERMLEQGPRELLLLDVTQTVLEHGGPDALRDVLDRELHRARMPVSLFVVASDGKDLLGRFVPQEGHYGERLITAADRSVWSVFFAKAPLNHGMGPMMDFGEPPRGHLGPPPSPWFFWPWMVLGMGLLASVLFAAGLAYRFSKPLNRLKDAFQLAGAGRLGVRIAAPRDHGEIGELMRGFDHMAGEIEEKIRQQNTLLHDVSHELRSPLARLNLAVGLVRQNPEGLEKSLLRIEREAIRLDVLIGELLNLSRLESERDCGDWKEHNLVELLQDLVADAAFEAMPKGKRVEFVASVPRWGMCCEPETLQRAFDNIIRNGIRYTPDGAIVHVLLDVIDSSRVQIQIVDEGPGVPEEILGRLFIPFFKHGGLAGSGLGLAIAKRGIERHFGTISVSNRSPSGLSFLIELVRFESV